MNTMPFPAVMVGNGHYETARFNALRHGVLSRYTVLPWENEAEYRALLDALVAEHAPEGPTEEHLVEELAGIIWRKRRLRMAEAAVFREKLRRDVTGYSAPEEIAGAALLQAERAAAEAQRLHVEAARRFGSGVPGNAKDARQSCAAPPPWSLGVGMRQFLALAAVPLVPGYARASSFGTVPMTRG
jgi:hypothetical protein